MKKKIFQWALAAAIAVALPMCVTSCKDDNIDNPATPTTPTEQPMTEPTEDAVEVTTEKSYVLYGVPSEGIGEAVCRRLKGSETAPFMAEVYVIDPSKTDELGIGVENWKEMVRRTWYGDAAVVLTQCSYRNFYRFTVNYILGALALKAEMNGEELDLGNYDSEHVTYEREVLANAVRNAYQMYRANHSAPGEVEEKDWAHIDQWPTDEQNAIMLDAYGFCQGNELYVMNANVNKPDTIDGEIIPPAQPENAYQWGLKANAVADWINRQGKEDAHARAGLASFRRALTRAGTDLDIESLSAAQQHEAVLDYKYDKISEPGVTTAYGAISVNHLVYCAYDFGHDTEYYQVRQHITVHNEEIFKSVATPYWWQRKNDGDYNCARGAWMSQIYTQMDLEGAGSVGIVSYAPTNGNGSTTTSQSQGGSTTHTEGTQVGVTWGASAGFSGLNPTLQISAGGSYTTTFSDAVGTSWNTTVEWATDDLGTEVESGKGPYGTRIVWLHNGNTPKTDNDTNKENIKTMLKKTCDVEQTALWKVEHPQDKYKLVTYFHAVSQMVKIKSNWDGGYQFTWKENPFDIAFYLVAPDRFKRVWYMGVYDYGDVTGDISLTSEFDKYLERAFGNNSANYCWAESFTSTEAAKDSATNARAVFDNFKRNLTNKKEDLRSKGYGGKIKFGLKDQNGNYIERFTLDLDKYEVGEIILADINDQEVTFRVIKEGKTDAEVELKEVDSSFKGVLDIPETVPTAKGNLFVTSVAYGCVASASGITAIIIPGTVRYIGNYAFYDLTQLTEVHVKSTTPPELDYRVFDDISRAFDGSYDKAVLYVPTGCKNAYANADQWKNFRNIVEE